MKFLLAVVLAVISLFSSAKTQYHRAFPTFEEKVQSATGALFIQGVFVCSGTEIGHDELGNGYFLTARHCVADYETNALMPREMLSFSNNELGPYYSVVPLALSLTDDIALLQVVNGSEIPEINLIGDEYSLKAGDSIFNSSFPLGMGKLLFHGEFVAPKFAALDDRQREAGFGDQWTYSMPMNLTIAHGSSGSGVFSKQQRALVGVAVGTFQEGAFNIAIPASRVKNLLTHLSDNTVEKFIQAHPAIEVQGLF